MEAIEGGCLCGAVRYRAFWPAYGITHCHCQTCRRASGAPFVTWAGFDTDTNIVTLFLRDGSEVPVPKLSKFDVANRVLDHILLLQEK